MNKRHYEHTLPNIRGSLSNTYFHHNIDFVYSTQNSYSSRKYTSYIENEHRLFKKNSLIVQCFGRLYLHGP